MDTLGASLLLTTALPCNSKTRTCMRLIGDVGKHVAQPGLRIVLPFAVPISE
jgi:hypothetical protein